MGHSLALEIYELSSLFPKEETFGLSSQIKRAAVSIPVNIAEGCGRKTKKDFSHFIQIAIGSACEVECELLLACDLGYISEVQCAKTCERINELRRKMIAFGNKLND